MTSAGGLLGEDQLAKGRQAQAVDRLAVFDFDLVLAAEEFGAAQTSRGRGRGWRAGQRYGRLDRRRCCRRNGATVELELPHWSGNGRGHRAVVEVHRDGDNIAMPRVVAPFLGDPRSAYLRRMMLKGRPGAVAALPAGGRHPQSGLQLVEAAAAALDSTGYVAVRDPMADTNNHGLTLMRTIRICK